MDGQDNRIKLKELLEASTSFISATNTEENWAEFGEELGKSSGGNLLILTNLTQWPSKSEQKPEQKPEQKKKSFYEITQMPTDNVLDLQYFFPYCDQLLRADSNRRINWAICGTRSDIERASCYLMAQNFSHEGLKIYTGESEREITQESDIYLSPLRYSIEKIGSLFPLLRIGRPVKDNSGKEGKTIIEGIPVQALFETTSSFEKYIKAIDNDDIPGQDNPQLYLLLAAGRNQINRISKNLRGSNETPIFAEMKARLLEEFWDYVLLTLKRLPLLTQLIWLYCLYYLSDQKELMTGGKVETLHLERIDLALWDAIAYGEGILQLLENCELHSCHKAGYFTMAFHDIGMRRSAGLVEAASKREKIYRRYRSHESESAFIPMEADFYLEFNVTDMAYDERYNPRGIINTSGVELDKLFSGEFDQSKREDIEKIIHHYGMPLFKKTVKLNKGRFLCATPREPGGMQYYFAAKDKEKYEFRTSNQAWTTYRILLPMTYQSQTHTEQFNSGEPKPLFDASLLKERPSQFTHYYLERNEKLLDGIGDKESGAKAVARWLSEKMNLPDPVRTVYMLDLRNLNSFQFEIYVKGLFYYLACLEQEESTRILSRIIFRDSFALCEFLRRAAIFYGKLGENRWMEPVQMALCIYPTEDGDSAVQAMNSRVCLILAGKNLNSAYVTAKLFAHYSLEDARVLLPQIKYLSRVSEGEAISEIQAQPQFPFDLVLRGKEKSQFLEQMMCYLNTDLQGEGLGCKLSKAHVRLGSKLHIADFYEAELLFHSIGHTYRFAYLIAEDLIAVLGKQKLPERLILVGYEGYSSVLVEQIAELLQLSIGKESQLEIIHMQFLRKNNGMEYISLIDGDISAGAGKKTGCVFIMPVGTTLSTIYKIKNVLFRQYGDQFAGGIAPVLRSYAVVVVKNNEDENLTKEYWTAEDELITLTEEEYKEPKQEGMRVRYFLMPETQWFKPTECLLCRTGKDEQENPPTEHIPLAQVDKTSTLPNLIFPLQRPGIRGISFQLNTKKKQRENDKRLEQLKGCIQYGHITVSPNHFQIYIDYASYYAKEQAQCRTWLKSLRKEIDVNAFNIIVSPRSDNDCMFVKNVVDIVFQHSLRLLFIPMETVYREDIRAKFSYITQEYRQACKSDFSPQINVYYVDYTMVSGYTLQRGRSLVNMLLEDAGIKACNHVSLFRKVILLVNRSSYDTINAIVDDPEHDFMAYATLAIPTFNTHQGRCPTCDLVDLYQEISKCSATNELYWYFRRLSQKHRLRSPEEHTAWQHEFLDTNPHYLQYLCQQLYDGLVNRASYAAADNKYSKKLFSNIAETFYCLKIKYDVESLCDAAAQSRLSRLTLEELNNLATSSSNFGKLGELLQNDIMPQREWRRMICTHRAMLLQERLASEGWEAGVRTKSDAGETVNSALWKLLQSEVFKEKTRFLQREWLISYLKVISRGYLVRIAPIRKSIYTFLELTFLTMTAKDEQELGRLRGEWRSRFHAEGGESDLMISLLTPDNNIAPHELLQMYQLYLTVGKRLCDLQSNLMLKYEMLQRVQMFLSKLTSIRRMILEGCRDSNDEKNEIARDLTILMPLPTEDQMRIHYVRLIKWATMSSAEESKAFPLLNMSHALMEKEESSEILDCPKLGEVLHMENMRLVYTGIRRMDESCGNEESWEAIQEHVKMKRAACVKEENGVRKYLSQNPLSDLFRFLDEDGKVQGEQLAAMLGFYRQIKKMEDKEQLEQQKNYIEQYNKLCFYIGKIVAIPNCCLVHQQNGQSKIIAQSLQGDDMGVETQVNTILSESEDELWKNRLYDTAVLWTSSDTQEPSTALILALQIEHHRDVDRRQNIYIVLYGAVNVESKASLGSYVLFMRQPFQRLLERDLYVLHHFQHSYEDVSPFSVASGNNRRYLLHLTDLHISAQNEKLITKLVQEKSEELKAGWPELLLITGDIVQGNSAAIDLEKNYQAAGRVIQKIAAILWPGSALEDDAKFPCSGWRKRVVIIPGNHDYAAMNELSATHFLRATNGGTPVLKDGSPMSRFSYYIKFLHECLHIDMSQSIKNNLNEIREYPMLKIRIIALNSVSEVGPLRNNKVHLDSDFIAQVRAIPDHGDPYVNIYLAHHTVCYKPDYTADRYYEKGMSSNSVGVAKEIIKCCQDAQEKISAAPAQAGEIKAAAEKTLEELKGRVAYEKLKNDHKGSALYSDIEYLLLHWDKPTNERCQKIFYDFNRNERIATLDEAAYLTNIKEIMRKIPPDIMLGGHTHEEGVDPQNKCIHGPRFLCQDDTTELRFGRLMIEHKVSGSPEIQYEFNWLPGSQFKLELPEEVSCIFKN